MPRALKLSESSGRGIERLAGRVSRVNGDFRDVGPVERAAVVLQCPGGAAVGRDEDIASGPGRYLLEAIRDIKTIPISGVLRDYKQENLVAAATLCDQLGITNISLTRGDAFDRASLAAITPRTFQEQALQWGC
jgi:hypothetical protein